MRDIHFSSSWLRRHHRPKNNVYVDGGNLLSCVQFSLASNFQVPAHAAIEHTEARLLMHYYAL